MSRYWVGLPACGRDGRWRRRRHRRRARRTLRAPAGPDPALPTGHADPTCSPAPPGASTTAATTKHGTSHLFRNTSCSEGVQERRRQGASRLTALPACSRHVPRPQLDAARRGGHHDHRGGRLPERFGAQTSQRSAHSVGAALPVLCDAARTIRLFLNIEWQIGAPVQCQNAVVCVTAMVGGQAASTRTCSPRRITSITAHSPGSRCRSST